MIETSGVSNGVDRREQMLICRVDTHLCALPLANVVETMRPLPVETVTPAPAYVAGISVIRGEPVPVIDVAALLGSNQARPTRLVTLRVGDRTVALAVDTVVSVRRIPGDALHALPPLLDATAGEAISAIGVVDAELLMVMRSARLVPEETWMVLESETSAS